MELITGASGFIGSALARRLAAEGLPLRCLARPGSDVSGLPPGAEIMRGDLLDPAARRAALAGADRVWHLAALVRPRGFLTRRAALERRFLDVNAAAAGALAAEAEAAGAGRFIYFSSVSALGPGEGLGDGAAPAPLTMYGRSKLEGERLVRAVDGLRTVTLRPAMIYGPGSPGWAPLAAAARRGLVFAPGEAANTVSICHIDNLLDAVLLAAEKAAAGAAFNVSEASVSIAELVRLVGAAVGSSPRLVGLPAGALRSVSSGIAAALGLAGLYMPELTGADPARLAEACASWSHKCEGLRAMGWKPRLATAEAMAASFGVRQ